MLLEPPDEQTSRARYDRVGEAIRQDPDLQKLFASRQARAQRQRANPPAMVKKVNFCGAAPVESASGI